MGNDKRFPANCNSNDFDRNIQQKFKVPIEMSKWCIIYGKFNKKEADIFMSTAKDAMQQLQIKATPPALFEVEGNDRDFSSWKRTIDNKINPGVQGCLFILQGKKNAAPLYKDIKKYMLCNVPVASQIVLAQTISAGKNLRSIVNKILMQF